MSVVCGAKHGMVSPLSSLHALAFCDHALRGSDLFVVRDAAQDPRFQIHPLVTQAEGIAILCWNTNHQTECPEDRYVVRLGRSCRDLSADQRSSLQIHRRQVSSHMTLRLQRRDLPTAPEQKSTLLAKKKGRDQLVYLPERRSAKQVPPQHEAQSAGVLESRECSSLQAAVSQPLCA